MTSLKGQLLLAHPSLADPNFERTVALMVQHDDEGAMALVLNRATPVTMTEAWSKVSETEFNGPDVLHQGGPCPGPLMVLHGSAEAGEMALVDGVWFSTQRELVEQLIESQAQPISFFVGYAGWGPGQLEAEISEGAWLFCDASADLVYAGDDLSWGKLVARVDPHSLRNQVDPRLMPRDPCDN